ncbi:MAG: HisA/HisF-related TIM barrel protein [Betaproteobacteria bacterium]
MKFRAIAKVVVFDGIAYQTNRFARGVYLGDPINVCNILSDQGCQELNLLFVGTAPSLNFVSDVLSVCRSPVSVGGVGEHLADFVQIVASGAEKIILSDSLWDGSDKPRQLCERFGRQAVAASVDYIEQGGHRIVVTGKSRNQPVGPLERLLDQIPQELFGEIVLTNVSRDGQATGLDYGVLDTVRHQVSELPLLLCGGFCGEPDVIASGADGLVSGTHFSLFGKHRAALVNYPEQFGVFHA